MYSSIFSISALVALVSAHGLITEIQGANGVNMPGLSVIDGTPRGCGSPFCGSEADTAVFRSTEVAARNASPLGRSAKGGKVSADQAIRVFMGTMPPPRVRRDVSQFERRRSNGVQVNRGVVEDGWSRAAGMGSQVGLPTASDDGMVSFTFHQVNQDGAGPLKAWIDPSSGGTDPKAFVQARVVDDVPGFVAGLSTSAAMDWPVRVQMPPGMKCTGEVGGASNVCVLKAQNPSLAGPFGGAVAFTQSPTARN